MALSWKTSGTISNFASQPFVGTVDVVEVKVAISAVPEVGDAGEDFIKEVVDQYTEVISRRSTA